MSYEKTTEGIRISVRPDFSVLHSDPGQSRFVFTYSVQMENQGEESVQRLCRHWLIHDSDGEDSEVEGEGVVGEQPTLDPGYSHHYQSFCVLSSPIGFMEGYYTFIDSDGREFKVTVPRFDLRAPWGGDSGSISGSLN